MTKKNIIISVIIKVYIHTYIGFVTHLRRLQITKANLKYLIKYNIFLMQCKLSHLIDVRKQIF